MNGVMNGQSVEGMSDMSFASNAAMGDLESIQRVS